MLLKDSLGGNCKTSMIANISIEKNDLLESVQVLGVMNARWWNCPWDYVSCSAVVVQFSKTLFR